MTYSVICLSSWPLHSAVGRMRCALCKYLWRCWKGRVHFLMASIMGVRCLHYLKEVGGSGHQTAAWKDRYCKWPTGRKALS